MYALQCSPGVTGTGVMVYGVASPRPSGKQRAIPPSVSFSIDGGIPTPVVSDPDLEDTEYSHQFYDSHTLSPDEHVLSMNVTQAEDDWPFVLDYILYIPLNPVSQPGSSGVAPSAQASAAKTSPHAAAIAGGVAGGIMLLLTAVLYGYLRRKALMDKHGPSINAVRKAARPTVDLLDDGECQPISPFAEVGPTPRTRLQVPSAFPCSDGKVVGRCRVRFGSYSHRVPLSFDELEHRTASPADVPWLPTLGQRRWQRARHQLAAFTASYTICVDFQPRFAPVYGFSFRPHAPIGCVQDGPWAADLLPPCHTLRKLLLAELSSWVKQHGSRPVKHGEAVGEGAVATRTEASDLPR